VSKVTESRTFFNFKKHPKVMMTKEDVDKQIQGDYERFYNETYQGELPVNFKELFEKAIIASASSQHQIKPEKLISIAEQPANTLTMVQVGIMVNVMVNIPMVRMVGDNFEDAVNLHTWLFNIKSSYNKLVDEFIKVMAKKTNRLYKLAGLENAVSYKPQDNLMIVK
jgi:hypothetical protein